MNERILSVSELNGYIKRVLDSDLLLSGVWIKGEISNFKHHTSGHLYMTLKDAGGAVRAVMFKNAALRLKFRPEDGMKVVVFGRVSVFESAGQYQVYIEAMQPDGVGALYVAYEQLKAKLQEEGLFSESLKKQIPPCPSKIAVITSPTGAAIRDILNVLNRRFKLADVLICPVLVQGDGAAEQVAKAIAYVNKNALADVIITGRGGGSIEDLWAFNEEIVARAIFESEIPVISAVGHETDFTIADFVADLRAPTPSAAAELAVPSEHEIAGIINGYDERMYMAAMRRIENNRARVNQLGTRISKEGVLSAYDKKRLLIDSKLQTALRLVQSKIAQKKENFAEKAAKLNALSPLSVLARGYSVAQSADGHLVCSTKQVQSGDILHTVVSDGVIYSAVTEIERK